MRLQKNILFLHSEKKVAKVKANFFNHTMFRFLVVGVVNTLFGMSIMFILYNVFHVSYWWSSAANYFFGSILSFILNKYYTFHHHGNTWKSALKFIVNILVCYLIAYGVAKPLMLYLLAGYSQSIQENAAMLTGAILFTALNYAGQRFFAFK